MSDRLRNTLYLAVMGVLTTVVVALVATAPDNSDRVERIGSQVKCPVCQGESIADSPAQMARDMMDLVREGVAAGLDDQQIIAELLSSYSGALLLDPPASGNTLILWLAPVAALAVGITVIVWWRRHPARGSAEPDPGRGKRGVATAVVISLAFGAVVLIAAVSIQDREGLATGVASLDDQDLESVSNETMEAVIAANLDHPAVDGMRLALANRYFEEAQYGAALDHYLAVAESPVASEPQMVAALVQMGRLVWDGNAEAGLAIELLDQALSIDPGDPAALYHKAVVLWCGLGDADRAAALFGGLAAGDLEPISGFAKSALDAIESGEECS